MLYMRVVAGLFAVFVGGATLVVTRLQEEPALNWSIGNFDSFAA